MSRLAEPLERRTARKHNRIRFMALVLALLVFVVSSGGCFDVKSLFPTVETSERSGGEQIVDTGTETENTQPQATPTPEPEPVFYQNIEKLEHRGIAVPHKQAASYISKQELLDLLAAIYESAVGEIDISLMNPDYGTSDGIRKLTRIGVYYSDSSYDQDESYVINYSDAAYWLLEIYKTIAVRSVPRTDMTAYPDDLLRVMNISAALYKWKPDSTEQQSLKFSQLLSEDIEAAEKPLTRLTTAHMMVNAYEQLTGDKLPEIEENRYHDTPDIEALKATNFFIWPENDAFEPELQGTWDDDFFLGTYGFDSQLCDALQSYEKRVPYGAVISGLVAVLESTSQFEYTSENELIVLNERPYPWHVYQLDTGEYGDVNCMPSCIEMSMRYQDLDFIPSAESLRARYPLDGQGWTDFMAGNLMQEYGLEFSDNYAELPQASIEDMLAYLDQGNILYVMYIEEYAEEGHSVIIKGYRSTDDKLEFIISDPNYTQIGPFGYPEYLQDAETMMESILRHVPRYFIIPPA